jgi:hypothetical protein
MNLFSDYNGVSSQPSFSDISQPSLVAFLEHLTALLVSPATSVLMKLIPTEMEGKLNVSNNCSVNKPTGNYFPVDVLQNLR